MSQPYVGEIIMFGGNFEIAGWAYCNGQLIPISENDILFQLIGTTYGGDGENTFALPNLQSRFPIHQGQGPGLSQNYVIGEQGGVESVTLTTNQIPSHSHTPNANDTGGSDSPNGNVWAKSTTGKPYSSNTTSLVALNSASVQTAGGSQPHDNMHPYLCVTFLISLFGVYPSPT